MRRGDAKKYKRCAWESKEKGEGEVEEVDGRKRIE